MVRSALFFFLVFLCCCKSAELSIGRKENFSDILKLNGFYWYKVPSFKGDWCLGYFFYKNGSVFYSGIVNDLVGVNYEMITAENIKAREERQNENDAITDWGLYEFEDDKIIFEKWEPSSGGGAKTVIRTGKILNDTTFVITKQLNHYDGKEYAVRDTFRFFKYPTKPDSTNNFIK